MIIELILSRSSLILEFIFSLLPDLPKLDITLINSLNSVFDVIFDHLSLLGVFVRISTIKTLVPLLILVINFERIYNLAFWIIHKIPMLNIRR